MDELLILLFSALLNGIMLAVGMIIGTRLTADTFEKKISKMIEKSETANRVTRVLREAEEKRILDKVETFFTKATELLESEEAKNLFKNLTVLLARLTQPPESAQEEATPQLPSIEKYAKS